MLKKITVPQLITGLQITALIGIIYFSSIRRFPAWLIAFPFIMIGTQIFTLVYQWRRGNKKPLKDTLFRYLVLIVTLLLLLLIFGKGIK
jgi:hypothetical protein